MPNFQQSVNQTLGIAGAFAGLSGVPQRAAEKRNLDKRQKILNKQGQIAVQDLQEKFTPDAEGNIVIDPQTESELQQARRELMRQNQEQEDISRRRYDLKPTLENYQKWQLDASVNQDLRDEYAYQQAYRKEMSNLEMQQQAMDRMSRQTEAKKTQQDKIKGYVDINAMYDRVKKGEISQDEYEAWFSTLPGSQPYDDR